MNMHEELANKIYIIQLVSGVFSYPDFQKMVIINEGSKLTSIKFWWNVFNTCIIKFCYYSISTFVLLMSMTSLSFSWFHFRSKHNRADLLLQYNTNSIALIDIITSLTADRTSGAIYDLKIGNYMTFDTRKYPLFACKPLHGVKCWIYDLCRSFTGQPLGFCRIIAVCQKLNVALYKAFWRR